MLYILLAEVLGVLGTRTINVIDFWQVVALGALINIIPDYISLLETRWVISRMSQTGSVVGQVSWLAFDFAVSLEAVEDSF